jgi:hypothetical protein
MHSPGRAIFRTLALAVASAVMIPGAVVLARPVSANSDWRELVGAAADKAAGGTAVDRRVDAATRLAEAGSPSISPAHIEALGASGAHFIDEVRFTTTGDAQEVLGGDRRLMVEVQSALGSARLPVDVGVGVVTEVLGADVHSTRAMLADARLLLGTDASSDQRLSQAARQLDMAISQWQRGEPVAVVSHLMKAHDRIGNVLLSAGASPYSLSADRDTDALPDLFELRAGSSPITSDTDGDGLTDVFEATRTAPFHRPDRRDSDGNGTPDPAEDVDGDGLTALQEQQLSTDPLDGDRDMDGLSDQAETVEHGTQADATDTDGDGLSDGAEVLAGLDPHDGDTDADGVGDAQETSTATVVRGQVKAVLTGAGDLSSSFSATLVTEGSVAAPDTGRVGPVFDLHLSESARGGLQQAVVTLPYERGAVQDTEELRAFTFEPELGRWVPVAGEHDVDRTNGTLTVTLEHFSAYAVFSTSRWAGTFATDGCTARRDTDTDGDGVSDCDEETGVVDGATRERFTSDPNNADTDGDGLPDGEELGQPYELTDLEKMLLGDVGRSLGSTGTGVPYQEVYTAKYLLNHNPAYGYAQYRLVDDGAGGFFMQHKSTMSSEWRPSYYYLGNGQQDGYYNSLFFAPEDPAAYYSATNADGSQMKKYDPASVWFGDERTHVTADELAAAKGGTIAVIRCTCLKNVVETTMEFSPRWGASPLHGVRSDPRLEDTDGDGVEDPLEVDEGTDGRTKDSDFDGLGDFDERDLATDPANRDTDGDAYSDHFEHANLDQGYDPVTFTLTQSRLSYLGDFTFGATCGDLFAFCRRDTVAWLLGNLVSGFAVYGDVRDAIGSAIRLEIVGMGMAAAGAIPLAGDALKTASECVTFLRRLADEPVKLRAAVSAVMRIDTLPTAVRMEVLDRFFGGLDDFRHVGVSDDALIRLAMNTDLRGVQNAVRGAHGVDGGNGFVPRWKEAEIALRNLFPGSDVRSKGFKTTSGGKGTKDYRFVDAWHDGDRAARESKSGYQRLSERIRTQIKRDAQLRDDDLIGSAEWHFYASGRSGSIGADDELLALLRAHSIPYFIHLP